MYHGFDSIQILCINKTDFYKVAPNGCDLTMTVNGVDTTIASGTYKENLIDEATVHYTSCHIKSHGWGALSSDGNGPTGMFVKDCLI